MIKLSFFELFDYSSVDNHPKLTEIGEMAKKATVNEFLKKNFD